MHLISANNKCNCISVVFFKSNSTTIEIVCNLCQQLTLQIKASYSMQCAFQELAVLCKNNNKQTNEKKQKKIRGTIHP